MTRKNSRKLSQDMHRKLSAISNASDISNLSVRFGMDANDFKTTINDILELDVGEAWELESEDGMSCYGDFDDFKDLPEQDVITVNVDKRKSSTGSQVSTDSLDSAEEFEPVKIDINSVKTAMNMYQRHKKISMSKVVQPPKMKDIKE